jgi:uncharacterized Rmd1/YagE family protein
MKPHTRKLYQLVRAKLHLGERDGIYEEESHISVDFVIRAFEKMESELIRWMFILWIGQVAITFMMISLLVKN